MTKLNNRNDVIERYWPDYLDYCMRSQDSDFRRNPTLDGFWKWYITQGPMGVKHANRYYNAENVEYV
jgi:hypothetical protein